MLYRIIAADHQSGAPDLPVAARLLTCLDFFTAAFNTIRFQYPDPPLQSTDLNPAKFLHCFADMFQMLARINRGLISYLEQMTSEQQQTCADLIPFKICIYDSKLLESRDYCRSLKVSLPGSVPFETPFDRMVFAVTEYQKGALKFLVKAHSLETHAQQTEKLFVAQFSQLADFYLKYEKVDALKNLLDKKNVKPFMSFEGFKSTLSDLRKSLASVIV
jgi:hypothetical protein